PHSYACLLSLSAINSPVSCEPTRLWAVPASTSTSPSPPPTTGLLSRRHGCTARGFHSLRPRRAPRRRPHHRPRQDPDPEGRRDPHPLQARRRRGEDQVPPLLLRGDHRHAPPQAREQERLRPRPQPARVRDVARRRQHRLRRAHTDRQDREAGDHQDAGALQLQAQGLRIRCLGHDQGEGHGIHHQGKDRCRHSLRQHEAAHKQRGWNHPPQEGGGGGRRR
ncbi:Late embryogenesis abundant protein group 2, partial [Zea mays]